MRIDPAIAALRGDPTPQLRAQAALEAVRERWRAAPDTAKVLAELDHYGAGADLGACPRLTDALAVRAQGAALVESLFAPLARALARHPLGHVPFRHQYSAGLAVLLLAESGRSSLSIVCYEALVDQEPARSICFAGGDRHELCLAGAAELKLYERVRDEPGRAELACREIVMRPGDRLQLSGPRHAKLVTSPRQHLLLLRLARSDAQQVAAREYRLSDGALLHVASGDRRESQAEMAAAALGAMGRSDAAPALLAIARGRTGASAHLRWEALRQALTLDTAAGYAALAALAMAPGDALMEPAAALRASLLDRHPQLSRISESCLA